MCSIIIVVIIYFTYDYHWGDYVELTFESVLYSNDSDFEQSVLVSLKGDFYKSLIGNGMFQGQLSTDEKLKYDVKLKEEANIYRGFVFTRDSNKNNRTIGVVTVSHNLDKIWIQWNDVYELYALTEVNIAGPANSASEAVQIARMMVEQ